MQIRFYQNDWWLMKQVEREGEILRFPDELRKGDKFRMRGSHWEGSVPLTIRGYTEFVASDRPGFDPNCGEIIIECQPVQGDLLYGTA